MILKNGLNQTKLKPRTNGDNCLLTDKQNILEISIMEKIIKKLIELEKTIELLHPPREKHIVELRIPKCNNGVASGYYTNYSKLAEDAHKFDGDCEAIYITLNPISEQLRPLVTNSYKKYSKNTTKSTNIAEIEWLFIDFDPKRASGISSSDKEKNYAFKKLNIVKSYLKEKGFPDPIIADSGNGYHLLYETDLPNDEISTKLVKNFLLTLDFLFSDDNVNIDTSTYDSGRVIKFYGTKSCKGKTSKERPHRYSKIIKYPKVFKQTSVKIIESINKLSPRVSTSNSNLINSDFYHNNPNKLDIRKWIEECGLNIKREKIWNGGNLFELTVCPFNPEHNRGEARIFQFPNGAIHFGCFHNSCQGYDWHALRDKLEPGWRISIPVPAYL